MTASWNPARQEDANGNSRTGLAESLFAGVEKNWGKKEGGKKGAWMGQNRTGCPASVVCCCCILLGGPSSKSGKGGGGGGGGREKRGKSARGLQNTLGTQKMTTQPCRRVALSGRGRRDGKNAVGKSWNAKPGIKRRHEREELRKISTGRKKGCEEVKKEPCDYPLGKDTGIKTGNPEFANAVNDSGVEIYGRKKDGGIWG